MEQNVETWPPCQAFYIESMLSITSSAIDSTEKLAIIFNPNEDLSDLQHEEILDWVQNIVTQAAALSRYFWAVKKKEKIHKQRSQYLRRVFGISEESAIKNRDLRNLIEHFDENLDVFVSKPVVGTILPNYVGEEQDTQGVPLHVFRAFYNRIGVFEVLGHRFELQPIVDEIYEIHRKLVSFSESGYVFRNAV
ncbi:cell cycle checkpoint control RAD9 family protein [Teredinibacter purpureus]|uniref:hypothetical protein n=1 Tax=Teredinibacter purpureus TaxID=2731756 RepID=UPI000695B4F2|nr:hypothetical protein [Teredinibacter purpureus]